MKVLMFFHTGSRNRGCEAIIRTAAALLKENPNVHKVGLASEDPESDRAVPHIDVLHEVFPMQIRKFSPEWFSSALHFKLLKDETYALRKIQKSLLKLIPKYDVFLSIGGDNYCYGEQPGIYEVDRQIKKAGKKLILWGASIGREDLTEQKIKDLKTFDQVLVRESHTQSILREAGIDNLHLVADGAFLMEKTELPLPEGWKEGNTIGFNYSPLVHKKNPESKKAAFRLLRHILDTTDCNICMTPHVILPGNNDHEVLQKFLAELKESERVFLLPDTLNATEYKGYIARMRFFIGARTHATIAAYSTMVPTMVLGYSIKSKGIAQDLFGEEKLVLDLAEISHAHKLIAQFEEMKTEEHHLRETLKRMVPEMKNRARKAGEILKRLT